MPIKMSLKEFIEKSNTIHNGKYDYTETKYENSNIKTTIICKIHGRFEQRPRAHLNGQGCPSCALSSNKRFHKSRDHFINEFKRAHGHKYDYSKATEIRSNNKITIICKIHGKFKQRTSAHIRGQGCPDCAKSNLRLDIKHFLIRANKIHNNKYDYSEVEYINERTPVCIICKTHGKFWQKPSSHLRGKGCKECGIEQMRLKLLSSTDDFIKAANIKHDHKYDYSKSEYMESKNELLIICPEHGEFKQKPNYHLNGSGCPKCAGTHLQNKIAEYVSKLTDIEYNNKDIIYPYEIDIYARSKRIGIEVNGLYWHSFNRPETKEEKYRHLNKHDMCHAANIRLLQINENEWVDKNKIIKSIIKSKLGLADRIYARKCSIITITNNDYRNFVTENHLQGYVPASIKYGLIYHGNIVAVMSFVHHKNHFEISRFANKININVIGGASKLFKHFLNNNHPKRVITYADRRYSDGNVYRKLGFELIKITKPNYSYIKNGKVFSRQKFQKKKLQSKLKNYDQKLSESQNMFNNGYRRIWDAGHYKFLWQ